MTPGATPRPGSPTPGGSPTPTITREPPSTPLPQYGVALSPRSFGADDFPFFFRQAQDVGGIVLWGGDASELADTQGAADVASVLARERGLHFGAQVGFHKPGALFDADAQRKASFDVLNFVNRTRPSFLVLGVELDRVQDEDPAFIDAFAPWYAQMHRAIKNASSTTLVFPSFQLENVKGWTGGLFGGREISPKQWDLLDRFPARDLTAFTTYPSMIYGTPESMPEGYYEEILDHVGGHVAFTEVGWHAGNVPGPGWESSGEEQARFLQRFFNETRLVSPRMTLWLHLYDQPDAEPLPFKTMGLVGSDGQKRATYDVWTAAVLASRG